MIVNFIDYYLNFVNFFIAKKKKGNQYFKLFIKPKEFWKIIITVTNFN